MAVPEQLSIPGMAGRRLGHFAIYHDESGTDPTHDRFEFHGVLIVPIAARSSVLAKLARSRKGYGGRIHFVDLRDRGSAEKAGATARWLDLWFEDLSFDCPYKCLIVDRQSPAFRASSYPNHHDLYNHAAGMALTGAVAWSLGSYDQIDLALYSEERSLSHEDPFLTSVPRYLALRVHRKRLQGRVKYPELDPPPGAITPVPGDPAKAQGELGLHCELVQLTDALTGAVAQAVRASAAATVKLDLGTMVSGWIEDTRQPPWLQASQLHRRFSVSCFPGKGGGFYDVDLRISSRDQPPLL